MGDLQGSEKLMIFLGKQCIGEWLNRRFIVKEVWRKLHTEEFYNLHSVVQLV
jgi:hypothetical protein